MNKNILQESINSNLIPPSGFLSSLSVEPVDPLLDSLGRFARELKVLKDPMLARELIEPRELSEPPPIPLSQA